VLGHLALLPDIGSLIRNLAFVEQRQRNHPAWPAQFVVLFALDARPSVILPLQHTFHRARRMVPLPRLECSAKGELGTDIQQ
jgi:hypothetical protein